MNDASTDAPPTETDWTNQPERSSSPLWPPTPAPLESGPRPPITTRSPRPPCSTPGHPPQRTRTFCFADLSGFTAFTREHGPHEAVERLGEFRRITRNVAAKRGVRVAKWLGDGVMLVGTAPSPTIAAGAHLIHHFSRRSTDLRVGIATGVALLFEGDDYIGEPVNLAAKLCAGAQRGEMLAVCDTADLPDWVRADGDVSVRIKGVGSVGGIHRLSLAI